MCKKLSKSRFKAEERDFYSSLKTLVLTSTTLSGKFALLIRTISLLMVPIQYDILRHLTGENQVD